MTTVSLGFLVSSMNFLEMRFRATSTREYAERMRSAPMMRATSPKSSRASIASC